MSRRAIRLGVCLARASLVLALLTATAACSGPGYYLQAASGHWRLVRDRQDVAEILAEPATDPELAARLETAREILAFADTELGLPASGSYSHYVATGRSAVAWNVVATPELSLQPRRWCFLVAGCVPYRAYFEEQAAHRSADRLAQQGMDTAVSPVTAYSTLGWFRDPLLDTMLELSEAQLAATLIHELAHQRLYLRGKAEFSEAYARFVERAGVERWLQQSGRASAIAQWRAGQEASRQFTALLLGTRNELDGIYRSAMAPSGMQEEKRLALRNLEAEYRDLVDREWRGRDLYAGWFTAGINNAHLALVHAYEGGHCAFAALFAEAQGDFRSFHRLAGERAKLEKSRLAAWLSGNCDAIAPGGEL